MEEYFHQSFAELGLAQGSGESSLSGEEGFGRWRAAREKLSIV